MLAGWALAALSLAALPAPSAGPLPAQTPAERVAAVEFATGWVAPDRPPGAAKLPATAGARPAYDLLEEVAAATGTQLVARPDGSLGFRPGPRSISASSGPFRAVVESAESRLDLTTGAKQTELGLLVHWPAAVPVFRLGAEPGVLALATDLGPAALPPPPSSGLAAVGGTQARLKVRLGPLPRAARRVTGLRLSLDATAAPNSVTLRFADLTKLPAERTLNGVTVAVGRPTATAGRVDWPVEVRSPSNRAAFESFEAGLWLARDAFALSTPRGERVTPTGRDDAATDAAGRLVYHLAAKSLRDALSANDLAGWSLSYRAAGPTREVRLTFAFPEFDLP